MSTSLKAALVAAITATTLTSASAQQAPQILGPACGSHAAVEEGLKREGQLKSSGDIGDTGTEMQLYTSNNDERNWTIVLKHPDGKTCHYQSGHSYTDRNDASFKNPENQGSAPTSGETSTNTDLINRLSNHGFVLQGTGTVSRITLNTPRGQIIAVPSEPSLMQEWSQGQEWAVVEQENATKAAIRGTGTEYQEFELTGPGV